MQDPTPNFQPLDAHKRLFSYCADQSQPGRRKAQIDGKTGRFLRSLILFDHLTIHSLAFREFPAFIKDLGLDATIDILNSKAVSLFPDFVHFGTGVLRGGEKRKPNRYSISRASSIRGFILPRFLSELRDYVTISPIDYERLGDALTSALNKEPVNYGVDAEKVVRSDLSANSPSVKAAVAARLRERYYFAIRPDHFELKMHEEGWGYSAETNLNQVCHLSDEEVQDAIDMAICALGQLNLRLEEMQMHSSLTGFDEEDIQMFESRLHYLIERDNPTRQESQFERIVTLLKLPEIPLTAERFDVERFLKLRTSPECLEFREWLAHTAEWSDDQILERVSSFRESFARFYSGGVGKALRIMISLGLGFASPAAAAAVLGLGQGSLDSFLLDRVLKPSGAIAFIASGYPSVFPTGD
jgi:hypothetical protein